MGNGCLLDMQVAVKVFPNSSWDEVVELLASNPVMKAKFNGAKTIWLQIVENLGDNAPMWDPSHVAAHYELGVGLSRAMPKY